MQNCIWVLWLSSGASLLVLYETDVTDVVLAHDYFLPSLKLESKGIRDQVNLDVAL
jgi:hypothetical protein